jgi:hypothetical protein
LALDCRREAGKDNDPLRIAKGRIAARKRQAIVINPAKD